MSGQVVSLVYDPSEPASASSDTALGIKRISVPGASCRVGAALDRGPFAYDFY